MAANLLAISVGNTRTQIGLFVEDELTERRVLPNDAPDDIAAAVGQMFQPLRRVESPAVYLASVNGAVAEPLAKRLGEALGLAVMWMERDLPVPIGRQLDAEASAGHDRLLNAAAAYDRLRQACIVVDAGTAVTVDFIDGEGTFHGGAIIGGGRMMLDALHRGAAQLPRIDFAAPEEPIGHNTAQAMLSGAFHGLRGAVRELVEKYAELYGAYPKVIATGGDAPLLFEGYDLIEAIVPELPLLGMCVARRYALEGSEDLPAQRERGRS